MNRRLVSAAVALVLFFAGMAGAQPGTRILVMPFENTSGEARIFWLGEAASVLLTDDLNALGAEAITREERRAAFERLQAPPATRLTDATVIRLGHLLGASQVVLGGLTIENDALVVRARAIALDSGRVLHDVVERGPIASMYATFSRVAGGLVPFAVPGGGKPRETPVLAAFENYIKGLLAGTPDTAIRYLTVALQIQPDFDRVRLALWDIYAEQDAFDKALAAVQPVATSSSWYRRARFLSGLSQLQLRKYDDAFAIFKALADGNPTAAVLNNLGVAQLHRAVTAQSGLPTYYFTRAADTDSSEQDYFFNLGYAYWFEKDTQATIYWLREAVRRDPADGDAHFVLAAALSAAGSLSEANRERELARRLSSTYAEWEKRPPADPVPRGLERIRSGVETPGPVDEARTTAGQRDQRELAQFYLDRGRRLYEQESDGAALSELNRAIFLAPYLAEAHLLVGRIHLRGGHLGEAIDALKIALWSTETAEAHAVLAEAYYASKDPATARSEADRALAIDPTSTAAKAVLEKIR